jgi:hypothetical protein
MIEVHMMIDVIYEIKIHVISWLIRPKIKKNNQNHQK